MRIVRRQELMRLPEGTLYTVLREPRIFDGMFIKGETCVWDGKNSDFGQRDLLWPDGGSDEAANHLDEMLNDSAVSYPIEQLYGREGLFDDEMKYMIYETADVKSMIADLSAYDLGEHL